MAEILLEGCCETIPRVEAVLQPLPAVSTVSKDFEKEDAFSTQSPANSATEDHEFVELQFEGSRGKKDDTRKLLRIQDLHS